MKLPSRYIFPRIVRKLGKIFGYRLDFTPFSIDQSRELKFRYLSRLAERTLPLEGDMVECGLGNGFSFAYLAEQGVKGGKRLYGFDSFAGFPKLAPEDASPYKVKEGDWGNVNLAGVEEKLLAKVSQDYYEKNIIITPGFFSDTLKTVTSIDKICFLHLDVDIYQSYVDCLEHFYDKVVPGGIIAIDELINGFEYVKYPGAFKAVSSFFADKNVDVCRDLPTGKYYILKH